MKYKLMVQSLSPLALLTIIRNFSFITKNFENKSLSPIQFIQTNLVLLIVMSFCILWVLLSIIFYIQFKAFLYTDTKSGYDVSVLKEDNDASLNFFLTLIVPLVIDSVNTWQGATVFFIILILICILLSKTRLFYANPVLSILGYHIYEFKFTANADEEDDCIGIGRMQSKDVIKFKKIENNIYYVQGN